MRPPRHLPTPPRAQVGIAEMRPLIEKTGGYCVMSESFTGHIFKQSFQARTPPSPAEMRSRAVPRVSAAHLIHSPSMLF